MKHYTRTLTLFLFISVLVGQPTFTEYSISTLADAARSVYATDVDGDGDMDVLSASYSDKIAWYENDGSESFTEHIISTSADAASSVYAVDVDADGDMDVLSSSWSDDKIAWYENDGSESFTEYVISDSAEGAWSVYAVDVDADGDMDVLSASYEDGKIAWYENDGSENFTEHVISTSALHARSVYAADVDGDGYMDVLSASQSDNKIAWYESQGPAAPTGLTLYPFETYVALTWSPVSDDDFQYYILERSTDSVFTEDVVSNELVSTYYEDDSLEYDTEYFYRVSYYDGVHQSEYSEVLSVTLVGPTPDPCELGVVYVSEGHTSGDPDDYIELYNSGDTDCSLEGFQLDNSEELEDLTFGDVVIPAGGYWVGYEGHDNSFTSDLDSGGDIIVFADPDNNSLTVTLEESQELDGVQLSQSFDANGVGCYTEPTPGSANGDCITLGNDAIQLLPEKVTLYQNYPNPFNPVTTLSYDLSNDVMVSISIYDMNGNVVMDLLKDHQTAGHRSAQWNGTNNEGQTVAAGLYLYTIEAGEFKQTKKMVLLK